MSPFLPPHQQYDFVPVGSPHLSTCTTNNNSEDLDQYGGGAAAGSGVSDYWTTYYATHCYSPVPQYYGAFHDAIVVNPVMSTDMCSREDNMGPEDAMVTTIAKTLQTANAAHMGHHRFSDEDAFAMASLHHSNVVRVEGTCESYNPSHREEGGGGHGEDHRNEDDDDDDDHHHRKGGNKRSLRKRASMNSLANSASNNHTGSGGGKKHSKSTDALSHAKGRGRVAARHGHQGMTPTTSSLSSSSSASCILPERFSACIPCRRRKIKCVPRADSHAYRRDGTIDGVCATCIRRRKDCFWPKLNLLPAIEEATTSSSSSGSNNIVVAAGPRDGSSPSSSSLSFSSSSSTSAKSRLAPAQHRLSSSSPFASSPLSPTTREYNSPEASDDEDNEGTAAAAAPPSQCSSSPLSSLKEEDEEDNEETRVALEEAHLPSVVESHFGLPTYAFGRSQSSASSSCSTSVTPALSPSSSLTAPSISSSSSALSISVSPTSTSIQAEGELADSNIDYYHHHRGYFDQGEDLRSYQQREDDLTDPYSLISPSSSFPSPSSTSSSSSSPSSIDMTFPTGSLDRHPHHHSPHSPL